MLIFIYTETTCFEQIFLIHIVFTQLTHDDITEILLTLDLSNNQSI